ncbi:aspartate semialdehyde dehydrogenase [Candidatus Koribacter versatilis Ellin345]|uniref:Aspartate semialdehyde dehydrogenase n=1 Tax=Koribacter versatilis (strain Ellin345) TaxID=204669 RepID=Q1IP41_KORVE|nr:Asd/ArgC dimerization domain-containing protein [Candidatus Koribacter versatilis]ABF41359.1 aspartate semialdehyde dehydrogenase [Candidatus Koribacter versatilis Ellin345]
MTKTKNENTNWGMLFRVAIVGAATLKGREIKEVLSERNFPAQDVRLLDDEESLGQLEQVGDEATFIQSLVPEHLANVDFAFFASDPEFTQKTWKQSKQSGSEIIDLSYALENEPGVQLRSPWIEHELGTAELSLTTHPVVVAHPAAVVLALLLVRAKKAGAIRNAIATVFEPASERGKRGMDELHEQTINLLSFQQLPMTIFGTQVAFNMVDRFGAGSVHSLAESEQRILRHFKAIVGNAAPVPSLMLLQTPTFHGHGFSLYIELADGATLDQLREALSGEHVTLATETEAPNNVSAAGQEQVLVNVRRDPLKESGFWIWATSDNLRVSSTSAVECAELMAASRPRGQVQ